jgi:ribosomal protein L37E
MGNIPEKETVACKRCGYEFLAVTKDPCPKCGNKSKLIKVEFTEHLKVSDTIDISTQKEQTNERKIVNWPSKIILVIILIGSPIIGLFLANIPGAVIGLLLDIVAWYLEKYAEKRYIEKTIERDHYH